MTIHLAIHSAIHDTIHIDILTCESWEESPESESSVNRLSIHFSSLVMDLDLT